MAFGDIEGHSPFLRLLINYIYIFLKLHRLLPRVYFLVYESIISVEAYIAGKCFW